MCNGSQVLDRTKNDLKGLCENFFQLFHTTMVVNYNTYSLLNINSFFGRIDKARNIT
jgi:hypothetical protein